jgi:cytochrome c556
MKSLLTALTVMAFVVIGGLVAGHVDAARQSDVPTIKKIMSTLHKGKKSAGAALKTELAADPVDWAKIKKTAKVFGTFGPALAKNDPPKGEKAYFEKLATAYGKNCEAIEKGAEKEDLESVKAAFGKIGGACMACHKAHRPPN